MDDETCFSGRLMVHPDWQGQGISARLLGGIEARFPEAVRYELFTGHSNHANLRLYQRFGYQPCEQQVVN